jgi:hypothetical protein
VPVSGLTGVNVATAPETNCHLREWYTGPTLVEALENCSFRQLPSTITSQGTKTESSIRTGGLRCVVTQWLGQSNKSEVFSRSTYVNYSDPYFKRLNKDVQFEVIELRGQLREGRTIGLLYGATTLTLRIRQVERMAGRVVLTASLTNRRSDVNVLENSLQGGGIFFKVLQCNLTFFSRSHLISSKFSSL